MIETRLAKISKAKFGFGGYQDAMIGLSVSFSGDGWGTSDFKGAWAIKRSEGAKWTDHERISTLGETVMFLNDLLTQAKKNNVAELAGTPVEVTFDGMRMTSWRVLTEVL